MLNEATAKALADTNERLRKIALSVMYKKSDLSACITSLCIINSMLNEPPNGTNRSLIEARLAKFRSALVKLCEAEHILMETGILNDGL